MNSHRRALARYLRREVAAYSPLYEGRLPGRRRAGVSTVPLTSLDTVGDPAELVLRPTLRRIGRSGGRGLTAKLWWARLGRRQQAFDRRVLQPRYKPVHWHLDGGVLIGYSQRDVERLAGLGEEWLAAAGVGPDDVLVSMVPAGPHLPYWQLVLGARRVGVPSIFLGRESSPEEVARLVPTTLAGRAADLARLLRGVVSEGRSLPNLETVLVLEGLVSAATRSALGTLAAAAARGTFPTDGGARASVTVIAAWAPPGVRALWWECRQGTGLHTSPDAELIELVDPLSGTPAPPGADGEIVWTPVGWRGTVLLRMRTGVCATGDRSPCPACGRRGPRLELVPAQPPFVRILDAHPSISAWQAELRIEEGYEELIVFLSTDGTGDLYELLAELDQQLSVTQFVVVERAVLDARLAAQGDQAVVDLRR